MVLEAAGTGGLLNAASTSEEIFSRFSKRFQEKFAELALRRNNDMDMVPFSLLVEFVDQALRLASLRLGRLMSSSRGTASLATGLKKIAPRNKPIRMHTVQSHVQNSSTDGQLVMPFHRVATRERHSCAACDSPNHPAWRCDTFSQLPWTQRKALVRRKCLCFNCLGEGHQINKCPSKARCKICHQDHHSLLYSTAVTAQNT